MWIPAPLYEALPAIYVGIGTVGASAIDDPLGWFLGGILVSVGTLIWISRRKHREPVIGSRLE